MAYFSEKTILQPPGASQLEGLEAVRGFLEELFQTSMDDFDSAPTRIVVSAGGDMACDTGWFRMPSEGPQGTIVEEGKYTIVWHKVQGQWKYLVGCFNNNTPEH
jgi:ketosteroid isomerase-like protein